ncbi:type II restriction endonuclease [Shewanella sp. FJAT-52076]|uniref:type II restriction endonuclease n=1 Tax=Shewanella sp. FJAT-52076 TaxID=2864202 RepID=UPI0021ACCC7E|nr:type II restriction endonuclease [Shewanella sp. FJAT-52076]
MELRDWLDGLSTSESVIYIKRLSANDTGATESHQVGIYAPKQIMDEVFPIINRTNEKNPETVITAQCLSHDVPDQKVRVVFQNTKFFGIKNGRNEVRLTRWGGKKSPIQNVEYTGSIAIFGFHKSKGGDFDLLEFWVCKNILEEAVLEMLVGEVQPGVSIFGNAAHVFLGLASGVGERIAKYKLPEKWSTSFPSGSELISYLPNLYKSKSTDPDSQLMERRHVEYAVFRQIEEIHELPTIKAGFETIEDFILKANSVCNRRKSRSGRSLELHLENIFEANGIGGFSTQAVTEGNKKPDFIFPSINAYQERAFPADKLRMLAVKTTCKDRWRQILNEADRITTKHLFTLQQGVSENQFQEMKNAGVKLVVPRKLLKSFPESIRCELTTLSEFIEELKSLKDEG